MTIGGPNYEYIYAEVRTNGHANNEGVLNESAFKVHFVQHQLFLLTRNTFTCNINLFLSTVDYFLCNMKLFGMV